MSRKLSTKWENVELCGKICTILAIENLSLAEHHRNIRVQSGFKGSVCDTWRIEKATVISCKRGLCA